MNPTYHVKEVNISRTQTQALISDNKKADEQIRCDWLPGSLFLQKRNVITYDIVRGNWRTSYHYTTYRYKRYKILKSNTSELSVILQNCGKCRRIIWIDWSTYKRIHKWIIERISTNNWEQWTFVYSVYNTRMNVEKFLTS